jgi:hypothetical protein
MTSDKCVLNDKLMLVGFILIFYVKKNTAQLRNKQTLTDNLKDCSYILDVIFPK